MGLLKVARAVDCCYKNFYFSKDGNYCMIPRGVFEFVLLGKALWLEYLRGIKGFIKVLGSGIDSLFFEFSLHLETLYKTVFFAFQGFHFAYNIDAIHMSSYSQFS